MPTPVPVTGLPGLLRRLAAMLYDFLVLLAVWIVALFLILPFNQGEALAPWIVQLYLLVLTFLFIGAFWNHGGQTLGMIAWRIRLVGPEGQPIGWRRAAIRFVVACLSWIPLGLGYWWSLREPEGRTWQDLAAGTWVIREPRRQPDASSE